MTSMVTERIVQAQVGVHDDLSTCPPIFQLKLT